MHVPKHCQGEACASRCSQPSLELGELMCIDALKREESCGGHFREEHEENGEALRDDENFSNVSAWEWTGPDTEPDLHREQLVFEYVQLAQRSYK